jgi:hypothetical protein
MRPLIDKMFEWLFALIFVLALLPCIVTILIHTIGPVLLGIGIIAVIVSAYRSYERARLRTTQRRSSSGGERAPVFPRGDH